MLFYYLSNLSMQRQIRLPDVAAWRKCVCGAAASFACFQRFHHSSPLALRRSMLRGAASALLRSGTEISSVCLVPRARPVRQSLRFKPHNRPFSLSVGLCKKKKKRSLWLELSEGQNMDGNIEEVLAPLRLAVKEQVTASFNNKSQFFSLRYNVHFAFQPLYLIRLAG